MPDAPQLAPDIQQIRTLLRRVADPEIGANIVDLGLIYRLEYANDALEIDLTMTSPACPMGDLIIDDIQAELERALPPHVPVRLQVVWEPPWNPTMMSAECRGRLGWADAD